MSKIIKFSYWVSVPVFLATLLYTYALLPDKIGIFYNDYGSVVYETDKSTFFYLFFVLFTISNGLIYLYQRVLIPKGKVSLGETSEMSNTQITYHGMAGLSLGFNLIYIFSMLYISLYNSRDVNPDHYIALIYIGPLFLVAWFFYFLYLRLVSK